MATNLTKDQNGDIVETVPQADLIFKKSISQMQEELNDAKLRLVGLQAEITLLQDKLTQALSL